MRTPEYQYTHKHATSPFAFRSLLIQSLTQRGPTVAQRLASSLLASPCAHLAQSLRSLLLLRPRNTSANDTRQLLLAHIEQQTNGSRDETHEDDGGTGDQPERRADIDLLAVSAAPVDMLAVFLVGELLGAQAAAREALPVALLDLLARDGELVQALAMAGAVVCCCDARAVRGEAAQVDLVGGGASVVGEFDTLTSGGSGRGNGDLVCLAVCLLGVGLDVCDGGFLEESTLVACGGGIGPVGVFRGAGGLGEEDQGCFEGTRGDGLGEGGELVDEGLEDLGMLSKV